MSFSFVLWESLHADHGDEKSDYVLERKKREKRLRQKNEQNGSWGHSLERLGLVKKGFINPAGNHLYIPGPAFFLELFPAVSTRVLLHER